ncbi:MAG: hypothetical protein RLZZ387_2538 [Chloroflexota bacterium]|jgi:predicted nucleic acid-binding protein
MSSFPLFRGRLLLDASSVISLVASGRVDEMLAALPVRACVIDITRRQEIRYIWSGPEPNVRQRREAIDLQPLINRGLLSEVSLDFDETVTMVNLAAQNLGNGESAATAIALHRGWGVCTDDFEALPRLRRYAPKVVFLATSQIIQQWAIESAASDDTIHEVLRSMRMRGGYGISTRDVLVAWLQSYATT